MSKDVNEHVPFGRSISPTIVSTIASLQTDADDQEGNNHQTNTDMSLSEIHGYNGADENDVQATAAPAPTTFREMTTNQSHDDDDDENMDTTIDCANHDIRSLVNAQHDDAMGDEMEHLLTVQQIEDEEQVQGIEVAEEEGGDDEDEVILLAGNDEGDEEVVEEGEGEEGDNSLPMELFYELYESYLLPVINRLHKNELVELRLTEDEVMPLLRVHGAMDEFCQAITAPAFMRREKEISQQLQEDGSAGTNDPQHASILRCVSINIEGLGEACDCDDEGIGNRLLQRMGQALGSHSGIQEVKLRIYHGWSSKVAASLLAFTRQIVSLDLTLLPAMDTETAEEETRELLIQSLRGHPNLIHLSVLTSYEDTANSFCTMLLSTLPKLRKVEILSKHIYQSRYLESAAYRELFRHPTITSIKLDQITFTETDMQIISNELSSTGTMAGQCTKLCYANCVFEAGGGVWFANALATNHPRLRKLVFSNTSLDESFFVALGSCLAANTKLQHLDFHGSSVPRQVLKCFEMSLSQGLVHNKTLRVLVLPSLDWKSIALDVLRDSLSRNTGLRKLEIGGTAIAGYSGDGFNDEVWETIAPFLCTNTTLEEVTIRSNVLTGDSCLTAACALEHNKSLKRFWIRSNSFKSNTLDMFYPVAHNNVFSKCVRLLGLNTSLESFVIEPSTSRSMHSLTFNEQSGAALVEAMEKNYGIINLFHGARWKPQFQCPAQKTQLDSIMRLNAAGRSYLINDPTSISKGMRALFAVRDDINCSYMLLKENPSLCNSIGIAPKSPDP